MFCNKCGKQLSEGVRFCPACGNTVESANHNAAQAVTEPEYGETTVLNADPFTSVIAEPAAPVNEPIAPAQVYNAPPVVPIYNEPIAQTAPSFNPSAPITDANASISKCKYIKAHAPQNIKTLNLIRIILSVVCMLALVFNIFTSLTESILDIPVVDAALEVSEEMIGEDIEDGLDEALDGLEAEVEKLEDYSDSEINDFEDEFDIDIDDFIDDSNKLIKTPSIINLRSYFSEYREIDEEGDTINNLLSALDIAMYVFIGIFAFGFLFALFGVIFGNQGLVITGHVLGLLYAIIFAGIIPAALTFVTFLALSIIIGFVNGSYKRFKKGIA